MTQPEGAGTKPARRRRHAGQILLLVPLVALIGVLFDVPILKTMAWSVLDEETGRLTVAHYIAFWQSEAYLRVIFRTLRIAAMVTLVTVLLGYPLAYWASRMEGRRRLVVLGLVVMTFWVSILVRTYAWIVVLGSAGLINRGLIWTGLADKPVKFLYNEFGIVVGMVNVLLPFLVLPLYAAMVRIDRRLLQVAETMGAGPLRIFWQVFFPLSVPALMTSAVLVFILCLGFYITPAVLGGGKVPLVANMMDLLINRIADWNMAAVVSVVLLAMTLSLYFLYQTLRGRQE